MENNEATRTCSQCNKEVAEANFALHETHCSRFLCLCPDCDEPVPREQLEQHRELQHSMVRCPMCFQKIENCHLVDHQADECVERVQSCKFCELELPWKELDEHCVVCGSRTELCRDCGRYVTLKDQPEHGATCSATNNVPGPSPSTSKLPPNNMKTTKSCSRCLASFPAEDIREHELQCVAAARLDDEEEEEGEDDVSTLGAASRLSSTYKALSLSNGPVSDPNQISTCPHCHLALPVLTLRWHEAKCKIRIHLKERDHQAGAADL